MTRKEALVFLLDLSKTINDPQASKAITVAINGLSLWDGLDREIRDLGVSNAFNRPGFRCNNGKSYKVINTNYHKGYDQALENVKEFVNKGLEHMETL